MVVIKKKKKIMILNEKLSFFLFYLCLRLRVIHLRVQDYLPIHQRMDLSLPLNASKFLLYQDITLSKSFCKIMKNHYSKISWRINQKKKSPCKYFSLLSLIISNI